MISLKAIYHFVFQVQGQGSLSVGDIIIINLGGETEEKLTIKMFGSIIVLEALKYDHEPGEKISLFQAAVVSDRTGVRICIATMMHKTVAYATQINPVALFPAG